MKAGNLRSLIKKNKKYQNNKNNKEMWCICKEAEKDMKKARRKSYLRVFSRVTLVLLIFNMFAMFFDVLNFRSRWTTRPQTLFQKMSEIFWRGGVYEVSVKGLALFAIVWFFLYKFTWVTVGSSENDIENAALRKLRTLVSQVCIQEYRDLLLCPHKIIDIKEFDEKVRMTNAEAMRYLQKYQSRVDNVRQALQYTETTFGEESKLEKTVNNAKYECHTYTGNRETLPLVDELFMPFHTIIENAKYLLELHENDLQGIKKGIDGEESISRSLIKYSSEIINLENVILPTYQEDIKTSEIDNLLLTPYGVFVLEVKNWGSRNTTIRIEQDGRWLRGNGTNLHPIASVTEQNIFHCLTLKKHIINNQTLVTNGVPQDIPIYPLIVIANDDATIENASSEKVIRASAIYSEIIKHPKVLSKSQMLTIQHYLAQKQLPDNQFERLNYEKLVPLVESDLAFLHSRLEILPKLVKEVKDVYYW